MSLFAKVLGALMLTMAVVVLTLYVQVQWFEQPLTPTLPILQKVVLLLLIGWMISLKVAVQNRIRLRQLG